MEIQGFLEKINKSKRPELTKFLKECDGLEGTQIDCIAGDPNGSRKDTGILVIVVVCRNIYNPERLAAYSLTDILADGKEKFIKAYMPAPDLVDMLKDADANLIPEAPAPVHNARGAGRKQKYDAETAAKAKIMHEDGMSYRKIGNELGLSFSTIARMCKI